MLVKLKLEKQIYDIMYKGYLKTFKGMIETEEASKKAKEMAADFAKAISGDLADAIDQYIKSATITSNLVQAGPQGTLVSPAGPVTGALMGVVTANIN